MKCSLEGREHVYVLKRLLLNYGFGVLYSRLRIYLYGICAVCMIDQVSLYSFEL